MSAQALRRAEVPSPGASFNCRGRFRGGSCAVLVAAVGWLTSGVALANQSTAGSSNQGPNERPLVVEQPASSAPACPERASSQRVGLGERVVLVGLGRELACALVTSLEPYGLDLLVADADSLGSSMPSVSFSAERVASLNGARAVVWLARDQGGYALWVYDRAEERTVARSAPTPPFGASVAAALALTVKTTVRMVGLVSEPEPEPEPEPVPKPVSEPEPKPARSTSAPEPVRPDSGPSEPETPPFVELHPSHWQLAVYVATRLGPFSPAGRRRPLESSDVRYGAELKYVPTGEWTAPYFSPWLALGFEAGSPVQVKGSGFEAELVDPGARLSLGCSLSLGRGWVVALREAYAAHFVQVSGDGFDRKKAFDSRLLTAADLEVSLGRTRLGIQLAASYWFKSQDYTVKYRDVERADAPIATRSFSGQGAVVMRVALE